MPEQLGQDSPVPGLTIDLNGMGDAIWRTLMTHLDDLGTAVWKGLQAHMGEIGTAIWNDLSQWMYSLLRGLMLNLWHASLLPIPHNATDEFGPVQAMMPGSGAVAAAGITLALALVGLRTILDAVWGRHSLADYLLGRFGVWVSVLSMLPWLIGWAIDQEQALARSVLVGDMAGILHEVATPNPIAMFLMIVFGLRLWLKLASNVVHVAVAVAWSPVAAVCGLIPATSHIASLWAHEFFGRLAGAVLATVATGLGLAIALTNGGDFAIFGVAGAFIAAHDLVDWLAKTPGSSVGGVVGGMVRTGAAVSSLLPMGGGGAAGALTAAASGGQAAMSFPALPAASSMSVYSFD
jgi:hypothetical protein